MGGVVPLRASFAVSNTTGANDSDLGLALQESCADPFDPTH